MNFGEWLFTEGKFFEPLGMTCLGCKEHLYGLDLVISKANHPYPIGVQYTCRCDSKLIANSVRGPESLINFLEGKLERYIRGFCNDPFCGYCYGNVVPLKNGYEYQGGSYDLWGCKNCPNNQKVLINQMMPEGEKATKYFIDFYKRKLPQLKRLLEELK